MNDYNAEVGERINELRNKCGYTREKLSELADISVQFLAETVNSGQEDLSVYHK